MFRMFAVILVLLAAPAFAQPQLYDVRDVAANDVLNIRQAPSASAAIIGALGPFAKSIEVTSLSDNAKWGLVSTGEASGWVSMRFMALSPIAFEPPAGLTCSGTEPFWFVTFDPANIARADWSMMGLTDNPSLYDGYWSERPANRTDALWAFRLSEELTGSGVQVSGIIRPEMCSDGMSDRKFGYSVDLILSGSQSMYLTGCCAISAD